MSYPPPLSSAAQDETVELRPKFDADGLIAAIAQDADTGDVLMLAWMNADALQQTINTGRAVYWSRSRNELWRKGDTSGHEQHDVERPHQERMTMLKPLAAFAALLLAACTTPATPAATAQAQKVDPAAAG